MNCPRLFMGLLNRKIPLGNCSPHLTISPSTLPVSHLWPWLVSFWNKRMAGGEKKKKNGWGMEGEREKKGWNQNWATHDERGPQDFLSFLCMSKLTVIIFPMSGHIIRSSVFEHVYMPYSLYILVHWFSITLQVKWYYCYLTGGEF